MSNSLMEYPIIGATFFLDFWRCITHLTHSRLGWVSSEHIKWGNSKSVKLPRPRDVISLPEVKFMVMVCL